MERTPVTSSSIAAVGYDVESRTLEVEFVERRVYRYFGVPRIVHATLVGGSVSAGRFFTDRVKDVYRCTRMR